MRVQKPLSTFHILFLSFEAYKLGLLEECKPFIGLDGCHLNGSYRGILLPAVALDANSDLFPLALCTCEKEIKFYARYIYANFRTSYCGDGFKKLFWKGSRSTNVYDFKDALKDIDEIKPGDKELLAKIEPQL
ncbi:hypothetical protein Ddye_020294 [Dipteronia dyeriana]|uniref:MULE transposase domain-containing protein n=1 Tax=Dipteronia dyeriana TaxID=168575 RepID=A0AAD9TZD5_9ROSI|nr:hypothetical protein Ddye_020294 [Dipteronia dyeriana]